MIFINIILLALFRRYFGGALEWPQPSLLKHYFKISVGYLLPFILSYLTHWNLTMAALTGLIIGTGWLLPYHAWFTWMGDDGHTLWKCFLFGALRYLVVTVPLGLAHYFVLHEWFGVPYMIAGALVPCLYWAAKQVAKPYDPAKPSAWLNGYTSYGELGIGALIGIGI